jgi:hypothetical protein
MILAGDRGLPWPRAAGMRPWPRRGGPGTAGTGAAASAGRTSKRSSRTGAAGVWVCRAAAALLDPGRDRLRIGPGLAAQPAADRAMGRRVHLQLSPRGSRRLRPGGLPSSCVRAELAEMVMPGQQISQPPGRTPACRRYRPSRRPERPGAEPYRPVVRSTIRAPG